MILRGRVIAFGRASQVCASRICMSSSSSAATVNSGNSGGNSNTSSAPKHKVPQKRASFLLNILRNEEFTKMRKNRDYQSIRAGDSVLVERLPYMSSNEPDKIKGLVIAKINRASDSALVLLNSEHGTPIKRRILMYSPLVQNITVLQKAFIHKGLKRVRRSKLYYLEKRSADSFTVN